jgi:hypothetical protein
VIPVGHLWHMPVVPSYMGGWDWEDHSSRPAQQKSLWDPILMKKAGCSGTTSVISATVGSTNRRITVQACLGIKWNSISNLTRAHTKKRAGGITQVVEWLPHWVPTSEKTKMQKKKKKRFLFSISTCPGCWPSFGLALESCCYKITSFGLSELFVKDSVIVPKRTLLSLQNRMYDSYCVISLKQLHKLSPHIYQGVFQTCSQRTGLLKNSLGKRKGS